MDDTSEYSPHDKRPEHGDRSRGYRDRRNGKEILGPEMRFHTGLLLFKAYSAAGIRGIHRPMEQPAKGQRINQSAVLQGCTFPFISVEIAEIYAQNKEGDI